MLKNEKNPGSGPDFHKIWPIRLRTMINVPDKFCETGPQLFD